MNHPSSNRRMHQGQIIHIRTTTAIQVVHAARQWETTLMQANRQTQQQLRRLRPQQIHTLLRQIPLKGLHQCPQIITNEVLYPLL